MKNSILSLGKALNKKQQKKINGGVDEPYDPSDPYKGYSEKCKRCFYNNFGMYNIGDRDCWGCPLPPML